MAIRLFEPVRSFFRRNKVETSDAGQVAGLVQGRNETLTAPMARKPLVQPDEIAAPTQRGQAIAAPVSLAEARAADASAEPETVDFNAPPRVGLPAGWINLLREDVAAYNKKNPGAYLDSDKVRDTGLAMLREGNTDSAEPQKVLAKHLADIEAAKPPPPRPLDDQIRDFRPQLTYPELSLLNDALGKPHSDTPVQFAKRFFQKLDGDKAQVFQRNADRDARMDPAYVDTSARGLQPDPSRDAQRAATKAVYAEARRQGFSPEAAARLESRVQREPVGMKRRIADDPAGAIQRFIKELPRDDTGLQGAVNAGLLLEARGVKSSQAAAWSDLPYPQNAVYRAAREMDLGHAAALKMAEGVRHDNAVAAVSPQSVIEDFARSVNRS